MTALPLAFLTALASAAPAPAAPVPAQPQSSCAQPPALLPRPAGRRAILDALRPVVVRELGGPVEFVVTQIRVIEPYAFVIVTPQRPGGGVIATPDENMDGVRTEAILTRRDGRWSVTHHGIGATDVWYAGETYNYPAGLIPAC
jgi:hypothetical protein